MQNTIFYLSTCDTCKRVMKEVENIDRFELVDIKKRNINSLELEAIQVLSGFPYEQLFNKRARKYKEIKDSNRVISDSNYKELIIDEYTFLKRPVIVFGSSVFVGNSKSETLRMLEVVNK